MISHPSTRIRFGVVWCCLREGIFSVICNYICTESRMRRSQPYKDSTCQRSNGNHANGKVFYFLLEQSIVNWGRAWFRDMLARANSWHHLRVNVKLFKCAKEKLSAKENSDSPFQTTSESLEIFLKVKAYSCRFWFNCFEVLLVFLTSFSVILIWNNILETLS